jgi:hypothetical protein
MKMDSDVSLLQKQNIFSTEKDRGICLRNSGL